MILPLPAIQVFIERRPHAESAARHDTLHGDMHRTRRKEIREARFRLLNRRFRSRRIDNASAIADELRENRSAQKEQRSKLLPLHPPAFCVAFLSRESFDGIVV